MEVNTTPYDVKDFANHILRLTKLDWNTTEPVVRLPITIKYARKVAALASSLNTSTPIHVDVRDLM